MKRTVPRSSRRKDFYTYGLVIVTFIIMQSLVATGNISSVLRGQLVPISAYVVMAISLNLTVGILGELSLGHAGFMSIGAFSGVIASFRLAELIPYDPLRLAVSMIIGAVIAGIAGVLIGIPVLRLAGDYLAVVTLAFGEIIRNLINSLHVGIDQYGLRFGFLLNSAHYLGLAEDGRVIVNGPMGITGINRLSSFTAGFILVMITLIVVLNLTRSRAGRAIMALRDNRIAAESIGIQITKYKLMAFSLSAALAGASGTLFAMNFSTVVAAQFNLNTSILILVFVVLGGLGNIMGSIIAAVVLTILPEMLREFNQYRMLVYAIILILVMIARNNAQFQSFLTAIRDRIANTLSKVQKGGKPIG